MAAQSGNEHVSPQTGSEFSPEANSLINALTRARDASDVERLRFAAVQTGHVAFHWNLASDLLSWSEAAAAVLGVEPGSLPSRGEELTALIEPDDRERRIAMLLEPTQVDDGDGIEYDVAYQLMPAGGEAPVVLEERGRIICNQQGEVRDVIGIVRRAVSSGRSAAVEIMTDPDTALASRAAVLKALGEAVKASEHGSCGLVLASISNIRDISETYGSSIVADVIRATGMRLRSVMRGADVLGRTGTAQFGIVLRECSSEQIVTAGDRFVAAIRNEVIETPQGPVWVELTAGAVTLPGVTVEPGEAFGLAEEALDQATGRVGPSFFVYEPSQDRKKQHKSNRQSAMDIVAALNEERFTLWHQPIVDAGDQQPAMYESLLRMQSPSGEIISAGHLVPIAEKLGFMQMIDAIVCRTSLDLLASRPDTRVSFNLSDSTLRNSYAVERLLSIVAEAGAVAHQVCIEVSHGALLRQATGSPQNNALRRLRELGCQIAMSGYLTEGMSISLLGMVDLVKLSGDMCAGIADRPGDVGLLRAAVEFAHRAGAKVVAERVESDRDAAVLSEAGVDYLQGYLFGKASPEHFNLTLARLDLDQHDHAAEPVTAKSEPAVSAAAVPSEPVETGPVAVVQEVVQVEQTEMTDEPATSQPEPVTQTGPEAIDTEAASDPIMPEPVMESAFLSEPHLDLLKQALGKLDSIRH
jgi:diguanylate cyclase (GGDEF)-like protein